MPEMNYALWEPDEGPGGGFSPLTESRSGELLVHDSSDDIEADLRKVEALDGKVLREKVEIPNLGWFAIFADPTCNAIARYTSKYPKSWVGTDPGVRFCPRH